MTVLTEQFTVKTCGHGAMLDIALQVSREVARSNLRASHTRTLLVGVTATGTHMCGLP